MERVEFEKRLATIQRRAEMPVAQRTIDGFTFDEWRQITDKIYEVEGSAYDVISIFKNGIDSTYPGLRVKYPELFAL